MEAEAIALGTSIHAGLPEAHGATKTSSGHRKMSLASVEAWLATREPSGDKDYRQADKAAGIYGVEEAVVMKAARRKPARTRG